MKLINNEFWYNLEPYLDMNGFDEIHNDIILGIGKSADHVRTSITPRSSFLDKTHPSFIDSKIENKQKFPELTESQIDLYTRLNSSIHLGKNLLLTGIKDYPRMYAYKHLKEQTFLMPWAENFQFLFDWINSQNIFSNYGRIAIWLAEPHERTVLHTDYADINSSKKDQFIWITGINPKRLVFVDEVTGEEVLSSSRAGIFNNVNYHGGLGHDKFTSFSIRVDGIFTDDFKNKSGLVEYFL